MRARILVLAGILAATGVSAQATGTAQGDWYTQSGSAKVRIAPCGSTLCGTIVWMKDPLAKGTGKPATDTNNPDPAKRQQPILGLQMIRGMKPVGVGRWSGGTIYDPQSGKVYASKMIVNSDGTLKVEGCISIICQGQTWKPAS